MRERYSEDWEKNERGQLNVFSYYLNFEFTTYRCENKQNLQYYITTESYEFGAKFGAGIELLTYYKWFLIKITTEKL